MQTTRLSLQCVLSVALLLVVAAVEVQAQSSSTPAPVITSVSGCQDVGNATHNCNLTSVITVYGSGFVSSASDTVVELGSYPNNYYCWQQDGVAPSNSSVVCSIASDLPAYWPGNILLPVVVALPHVGVSSAPFYGVSMFHTPLPALLTISGCNDSSNTQRNYTQNCDPSSSVLTITGSAFSFLAAPDLSTLIVLNGRIAQHAPGQEVLQVVNDTYMLVPLSDSYLRLVEPDHYGGAPLSFSIQWSFWTTNALLLSLIPTPPPVVLALSGCAENFPLRLTGCVPGVDAIAITGQWFISPVSVQVAGLPCRLPTWTSPAFTSTQISCILPSFTPTAGAVYDLLVNTTVYSDSTYLSTVSGAFEFASGATLTMGMPCINNGINGALSWVNGPANMKCQGGAVVYWLGYNFPAPVQGQTVQVLMTVVDLYGNAYEVLQCGGAVLLNTTAVSCTLPQLGPANGSLYTDAYQWGLRVQLQFSGGVNSTNSLTVDVYDAPNPPYIFNISGCGVDSSPSLTLSACFPDDQVTLSGVNFYRGTPAISSNDPFNVFLTAVPYTGSTTELVLQPTASSPTWPTNTPFSFTLRQQAGTSNSFTLTFISVPVYNPSGSSSSGLPSPPSSDSSSSSSSSGLSAGGIAGVVIGAIVLLSLLLALLLLHRRRSKFGTTLVDEPAGQWHDGTSMEMADSRALSSDDTQAATRGGRAY